MSGTLIAILRFTGVPANDFPDFSAPFLPAADAFLLLAVGAETLLLLTFLDTPLVDVLVAVFLTGFPFVAIVAVFFLEAAF